MLNRNNEALTEPKIRVAVLVSGGDASGIGIVIVPDGPVSNTTVNSTPAVTPAAEETYFLGILPD